MTNGIYTNAFSPNPAKRMGKAVNIGHAIECAKIDADKFIKRTNRSNAVIRENKKRTKRNLLHERHVNHAKHLLKFVTTDTKGVQTVQDVKINRITPSRAEIRERKQKGIESFCKVSV